MQTLFAYGTLMCAAIMTEVSGLAPAQVAGRLRGYSRRAVRGEWYPGLVPEQGGLVEGVVYRGIPAPVWKRLDRFEGRMYARETVAIELADGSKTDAWTYVFRPQFRRRLSANDWDYLTFLESGITRFRCRYSGYGQLKADHRVRD